MTDLLPCPFCGATDGTPQLDGHQGDKWGAVMCSCGVFGPEVRTGYDDSPNAPWHAEAIAAWNTRATQPPAVGVDEMPSLPPLPRPWGTDYDDIDNEEVETFTASQMKAYARAALTAALRTGGGE